MLLSVKPGATPLTRMLLAESCTDADAMRPWSADFATAVEYQHAFDMWIAPFLLYGKSE